jgi:hypothetical protein
LARIASVELQTTVATVELLGHHKLLRVHRGNELLDVVWLNELLHNYPLLTNSNLLHAYTLHNDLLANGDTVTCKHRNREQCGKQQSDKVNQELHW